MRGGRDDGNGKKLRDLREKTGSLKKRGRTGRPWEVPDKVDYLLGELSLAGSPLFLEETCRDDGVPGKESYSMFTFEPFRNLYLCISRLSKTWLTQYLSSNEIYSHPRGPPG